MPVPIRRSWSVVARRATRSGSPESAPAPICSASGPRRSSSDRPERRVAPEERRRVGVGVQRTHLGPFGQRDVLRVAGEDDVVALLEQRGLRAEPVVDGIGPDPRGFPPAGHRRRRVPLRHELLDGGQGDLLAPSGRPCARVRRRRTDVVPTFRLTPTQFELVLLNQRVLNRDDRHDEHPFPDHRGSRHPDRLAAPAPRGPHGADGVLPGVGWQAQAVSYPLFRAVPTEDFLAYHAQYNEAIPLVVIVPGFLSFLACAAFPWTGRPTCRAGWRASSQAAGWCRWCRRSHGRSRDTTGRQDRPGRGDDREPHDANLWWSLALTAGAVALVVATTRSDRSPASQLDPIIDICHLDRRDLPRLAPAPDSRRPPTIARPVNDAPAPIVRAPLCGARCVHAPLTALPRANRRAQDGRRRRSSGIAAIFSSVSSSQTMRPGWRTSRVQVTSGRA